MSATQIHEKLRHEHMSDEQLVWRFIEPGISRPVEGREIASAEEEMWGAYGPPDEIVFASGSVRKAVNFLETINGVRYVIAEIQDDSVVVTNENPTPLEFYAHLSRFTTNGNGELKEKVLLGYLQGVPIYVDHQNGEEDDNNHPTRQAVKKVEWYVRQKCQGRDVIVIACDTVDGPRTDSLEYEDASMHPNFPQADRLLPGHVPEHTRSMPELQNLFRQVYESIKRAAVGNQRESGHLLMGKPSSLENFPKEDPELSQLALYFYSLILFYSENPVELIHTNGIAMMRTFDRDVEELNFGDEMITATTDLHAFIPPRTVPQAFANRGNGGVTEEGVDYQLPGDELFGMLFEANDLAWPAWLNKYSDLNDRRLLYELNSLITGMPGQIILYLIARYYFKSAPKEGV